MCICERRLDGVWTLVCKECDGAKNVLLSLAYWFGISQDADDTEIFYCWITNYLLLEIYWCFQVYSVTLYYLKGYNYVIYYVHESA